MIQSAVEFNENFPPILMQLIREGGFELCSILTSFSSGLPTRHCQSSGLSPDHLQRYDGQVCNRSVRFNFVSIKPSLSGSCDPSERIVLMIRANRQWRRFQSVKLVGPIAPRRPKCYQKQSRDRQTLHSHSAPATLQYDSLIRLSSMRFRFTI